MGHTLSIAAGIAMANKNQKVCLDGDGAAIMHLGSLPVTGCLNLPNLVHIVLNNGAHESVGGQPTVSYDVDLNKLASAANFSTMESHIETRNDLSNAILNLENSNKPCFIEVRIRRGMDAKAPPLSFNLIKAKEETISKPYFKEMNAISLKR